MWERESAITASPRDLQLFTLDTSPEMLAAALFAGFFPFASEFAFPGRPLQERGLLNLELAGPEIDWQEGDAGGRLVLDLSESSTDRLMLGKRSIKTVRAAVSNGAAAGVGSGGPGTPYRLTVCAAFERSWQQIVAHHGVDWCGFSAIQAAYRALHEHSPRPWDAASVYAEGRSIPPRVISVELWDASLTDELVSAEIGVIVGRCYVCLSLFSRSNEYPRCDSVRLGASVVFLRRAGVELFDAGTTADYFARYFGYRRCASRRDFAALWRRKRALGLANPRVLSQVCDNVRGLLETYQKQVGGASEVCQMAAASAAAATQLSTRTPKHTVRISGLSPGVAEAELRAALAQAMPAVIGDAIARLTIAEHLGAGMSALLRVISVLLL
jgi:Leu/Phe-tRNA-protein transferase